MKKWMYAAGMVLAMSVLLTGCDSTPYYDNSWNNNPTYDEGHHHGPDNKDQSHEDALVSMAQTLAGQWRGDMKAYKLDERGVAVDSTYYETDIEFTQYNSTSLSGTGMEYDFEPRTQKKLFERSFSWHIDPISKGIYLNFKEKNVDGSYTDYIMSVAYDDLNLNDRTFTGMLYASNRTEVDDFYFNRYTESRASGSTEVTRIKVVMSKPNRAQ